MTRAQTPARKATWRGPPDRMGLGREMQPRPGMAQGEQIPWHQFPPNSEFRLVPPFGEASGEPEAGTHRHGPLRPAPQAECWDGRGQAQDARQLAHRTKVCSGQCCFRSGHPCACVLSLPGVGKGRRTQDQLCLRGRPEEASARKAVFRDVVPGFASEVSPHCSWGHREGFGVTWVSTGSSVQLRSLVRGWSLWASVQPPLPGAPFSLPCAARTLPDPPRTRPGPQAPARCPFAVLPS